ncbi:MAG: hypothetical protein ACK5TK_16010 [Betaproteobacteria bacterium]
MNKVVLPLPLAEDHPAFAGHFPGRPILPGAVLLTLVLEAIETHSGRRASLLPAIKFLRPLLPGAQPVLWLEAGADSVKFEVHCDGALAASGRAVLAAP